MHAEPATVLPDAIDQDGIAWDVKNASDASPGNALRALAALLIDLSEGPDEPTT